MSLPSATTIALVVLLMAGTQAFAARLARLGAGSSPDSRWSYSPSDLAQFFAEIGETGRWHYGLTELSLDMAFPIVYALLLSILLAHAFRGTTGNFAVVIPFLAAACDWLENALLAWLAFSFDGGLALKVGCRVVCMEQAGPIAAAGAQLFTRAKIVLLAIGVGLLAIGAVLKVAGAIREALGRRRSTCDCADVATRDTA